MGKCNSLDIGEDIENKDFLNPGFYFSSGYLYVRITINGTNYLMGSEPLPLMQWSKIKVLQEFLDGMHTFSFFVNSLQSAVYVNKLPVNLSNVTVYVSNPWNTPQPGLIRNMVIQTGINGI